MNVVDSSGWLEYFANGANAEVFSKPIEQVPQLLVPSITITEVFKRVLQQRGEQAALQAAAQMNQGRVIGLDVTLAVKAAKIGYDLKLPLADSIILATARAYDALLWTQDEDFKGIPGVRCLPKR
ncbi:MAG: type II toxin-antitoxin system VapC family toxin [Candidatus Omnitrophica bacterium]|nr:type II toxin-antitoxin system VapC family toxin [Candidatus Omnitrophota bacterium]